MIEAGPGLEPINDKPVMPVDGDLRIGRREH